MTARRCQFTAKLPRHLTLCELGRCRNLAVWCVTPEGQPHVHMCERHKSSAATVLDLCRVEFVAVVLT